MKSLAGSARDMLITSSEKCPQHDTHLQKIKYSPESIGFVCPICQREDKDRREQQRLKEVWDDYQRSKTSRVLHDKSIFDDETLESASFKTYQTKLPEQDRNKAKAIEIAKKYLNGEVFNTILTGNAGAGKSHLAMSILKSVNEYSRPYKKCLFVSWDKVVREIRTGYFSKDSSGLDEGATIDLLTDVDLLVIDDLGAELGAIDTSKGATDYVVRLLYAVMNGRQTKSTIFTTNLTSVQIKDNYDSKTSSRIMKRSAESSIVFKETEDQRPYY
ncbi:ATP-binding protein [Aerococcus sp. UMB8608]|uniref:IstB-like ATP-binding domain-containing protein n=1 Tax=Aerococcus sanguinicola TaxID=119206 RepID=A0A0X8F9K5_9LACT|nr:MULTISPECIES: ATP-binding protein [Aerococcus]AMB93273.1 hypothetical protein AWM72_00055 [Aerococcus sanguinicola]MDK6679371.1 ATP-binding protein [Aerococcus sp. UMB8608]MDK6685787.1 ATP-binding protein [Aerococcus sp. UMB8623]OFT95905.1 hypothetical protein HMPREF3090_03535 [Aerococcus sp. HMSC23C02]